MARIVRRADIEIVAELDTENSEIIIRAVQGAHEIDAHAPGRHQQREAGLYYSQLSHRAAWVTGNRETGYNLVLGYKRDAPKDGSPVARIHYLGRSARLCVDGGVVVARATF